LSGRCIFDEGDLANVFAFDGAPFSGYSFGEAYLAFDGALSALALLKFLGVYWSNLAFFTIFKFTIVESTSFS